MTSVAEAKSSIPHEMLFESDSADRADRQSLSTYDFFFLFVFLKRETYTLSLKTRPVCIAFDVIITSFLDFSIGLLMSNLKDTICCSL